MPSIINATTSTGLVSSADNSGSLQLQTNNGTTAVTIDTSQNVGIGTSSPTNYANQRTLAVNGTTYGRLDLMASGTVYGFLYGGTIGPTLASSGALPVMFETNGTERMRIDSAGNLGIGASPTLGGRLEVSRNGERCLVLHNTATGTAANAIQDFYRNGTQVGAITTTGTNTTYGTGSDYRLKENIAPMTGALVVVAQLKPVTYKWKLDGSAGQGFIAHELQEVIPDAVTGEKDAVNEDNSIKIQTVDTSFLVATLTAAIQELKAELDATKAEVQALKGVA
jgi:hypothetical protein